MKKLRTLNSMRRAECGYDFGEGDGIEQKAILSYIKNM